MYLGCGECNPLEGMGCFSYFVKYKNDNYMQELMCIYIV